MSKHSTWFPAVMAAVPLAWLAAGCFLPVSTAAPQSALTVGKGSMGATLYSEFPTLDLLATQTDEDPDQEGYITAPMPTATFQLGYGITDRLDLEVAVDGVLYFVLPLPLGGSIGGRYQVLDRGNIALAASARLGYVGLGTSDSGSEGDVSVSAAYGAITLASQLFPRGVFRPGLAFSVMPASITNEIKGSAADRYFATAASVTFTAGLGLGPLEVGPFANLVYFASPNLHGTTTLATGGLMLALRHQRRRPEPSVRDSVDPDEWQKPPEGKGGWDD